MTWIAACSGQRGTYKEVIMTTDSTGYAVVQSHESYAKGFSRWA